MIAIEEDGRMSRRLARLDKTSESIRTVIGGIPDDVLIDLLRIGDNWTISHTVIDIYDEEALKKIVSEDLEKYWLKLKHMKNKPIREPRPEVWVHGHIEFHIQPRTISFSCPICGCPLSKVHQWEERGYSHIKAFGCTTKLVVRLPKMRCGCCGGWPQLEPEWVRPGSSYTVPFEKLAFSLIRNTSVSCVEEILDISDTTLWRMIDYRVSEALNYLDLSNTYAIYIDEKSKKKGQNYVTVVLDQCGSVIFVCDGRGSDTVSKFASWLESHSGRKENIIAVSCDLGESYPAGVRREFPDATIVYDHYHTMKIVDEKFETVYSRCLNLDNHLLGKKRLLQKRSRELDDKQENVVQ